MLRGNVIPFTTARAILQTNYLEAAWDLFRSSRILRVRFASSESRRGISTAGAKLKILYLQMPSRSGKR